ncbi:MAG: hypothetical protein A3I11_01865 [Elusimicrobia bacterium RIFCSPLOWO2_02_FULL_39_32]|nr:MAG: hypothetical protein A3B80_06355 [Elusimicrobia bacterium RIFCSPHIGHO2_02_FULL_39_36]OGR92420.1 MAG: hypothetical protein A3I11_01865 [Elusimicrobia bacterium RIFCSPLOWO2_02_FULL_39_32]OGR98976.1 MAG: hypothetical protein A3G85_04170 [Elusimicrobia bacterium RIFCSPLOWO2_12_FULL_39_28]
MIIIVCITALIASFLTLFSGFGLGTLLMPAFALFFPLELAIAMTGIVHLSNNLFKLSLFGKMADGKIIIRFGLPAIAASYFGAQGLLWLSHLETVAVYAIGSRIFNISPIKLTMAALIFFFALLESVPALEKVSLNLKWLPLGGILSGFFGGLSGHQGVLRSAFLIRAGLTRDAFIATGVVIACMVDAARLPIYFKNFVIRELQENRGPLFAAVLCAFLGTWMGSHLLKKTTIQAIKWIVSAMLFLFAILLAAGLI